MCRPINVIIAGIILVSSTAFVELRAHEVPNKVLFYFIKTNYDFKILNLTYFNELLLRHFDLLKQINRFFLSD